jgi:hypothetical protein
MPTHRKFTLSLSTQLLQQLQRLAARRHISVADLVTQTLEELVAQEDNYARARKRHLAWLEHAADLGTEGEINSSRDSLHQR